MAVKVETVAVNQKTNAMMEKETVTTMETASLDIVERTTVMAQRGLLTSLMIVAQVRLTISGSA